ncbi:hypothetical protein U27_01065 [Candidatus Vecturithrix granuli]|uniref:Uncharacterized protein n=1 Tax=Vecturithrix granuli TaxID=1499967 RepID=A0A081C9B1_VECG1|nr:hypothetical protein U27_01065 [Candidatus Vecturithrix granuli]
METMISKQPRSKTKTKRKTIPRELIYEMRHGTPIYYRDYQKVVANEKSLEEVMGSSALQGQLIAWIVWFLLSNSLYAVDKKVL